MASGTDDFQKIENKLGRARRYINDLRNSTDQAEASLLWENYISVWCQAQKLLGKFCRLHGLGGLAEEIKEGVVGVSRPCAKYLLHARNAEEHSFRSVVRKIDERRLLHVPGYPFGAIPEGSNVVFRDNYSVVGDNLVPLPNFTVSPATFETGENLPPGSIIETMASFILPVSVVDRGQQYDPPELDVAIEDWAIAIAEDAASWLEAITAQVCDEIGWVR